MSARLASGFWVSAYLARLRLADIPAFVVAKGDATAGAVIVKSATLDGRACAYTRSFDLMNDCRTWVALAEGALRGMSLTTGLAPLVVLVGHGRVGERIAQTLREQCENLAFARCQRTVAVLEHLDGFALAQRST